MYKIQEIREMIKLVDASSIEVLEIEEGNSKILISRKLGAAAVVPQENNTAKSQANEVAIENTAVLPTTRIKEISAAHVQVAVTRDNLEEVHIAQKNEEINNLSKIVSPML
jgi:hypothetical protein